MTPAAPPDAHLCGATGAPADGGGLALAGVSASAGSRAIARDGTVAARKPRSVARTDAAPASLAARIDALCRAALLDEAMAWPKPGLVTPRDSGSHRDMNIATFIASVGALDGCFAAMAEAGAADAPLAVLQRIGIEAELRMRAATAGVNTHRGAIFNLGLLAAAVGLRAARPACWGGRAVCAIVRERWGDAILAARAEAPGTHGNAVFRAHAAGGARAEAAAGFPSVTDVGLPALRRLRAAGIDGERALVGCLMALMAELDDTNLLWRGGTDGLAHARAAARGFLAGGGVLAPDWQARLCALHDDFVARRLSPGGSADLVAASVVADALDRLPDAPRRS
ncbi:triphosphoribosyl-dephospho-CoA synthase MdcB [Derxia gummosa]|uniref:Probable 2-(5''-triphosphoribosyl)-3'-dephosphocoenzyme-A synthase n=1 Tax=Derxia gummosa DSM 723 TaxID=1121388 RepID=A0A8B6XB44_9BURK|nr:triphosphoribosyl-dephospho-CoA synthase MdcB [Derxia gummosa]